MKYIIETKPEIVFSFLQLTRIKIIPLVKSINFCSIISFVSYFNTGNYNGIRNPFSFEKN
jgi:hypothetical protein